MPRYIDADKFISWLDVGHLRSPSEICLSELNVLKMIDLQPTADVVEVVRCRDCKHFTKGMAIGMCKRIEEKPIIPCPFIPCHCEHYCSYGERRDT